MKTLLKLNFRLLLGILALLPGIASNSVSAADVCSQGVGIPPFLSAGADPNLLLVLDNSGSMLDMAYIDKDTDGTGADRQSQCFDEGYLLNNAGVIDPATEYAGLYTPTQWYKWQEGIPVWEHKAYLKNDLVYSDGLLFRALTAGTSTGENIYEDIGVKWENILRPSWKSSHIYHPLSFIFDTDLKKVWYTETGGTSGAVATGADTDPLVDWIAVERWQTGTVYDPNSFVLWDDFRIYFTAAGGTSTGTQPLTDEIAWVQVDYHGWQTGVSYYTDDIVTYKGMIFRALDNHASTGADIYADDFATHWLRLDEGYFDPIATEADAQSFCSSATGVNKHIKSGHLCITIDPGTAGSSPDEVTAFAASGNFLNWATASKFDIQKKILTGGKYDAPAERLISESRGCAGSRFIKQTVLDDGKYITLSIRSANADDRVDSTDDTGRLEIFAVSATGIDFERCQDAIDSFNDPTGLGPAEQDVAACVGFDATGGSGPIEHIIYHKAIQECWFYAKHGSWKGGNDHPLKTCPEIYENGQSPLGIDSTDPTYVCWGIYDAGPHEDREGYVGRCWEQAATPPGTCVDQPCSVVCASPPCYFDVAGDSKKHRCLADGYEDRCTGNFNSQHKTCNGGDWVNLYWDTFFVPPTPGCTPAAPVIPSDWSTNLDGDAIVPDADAAEICVNQAMQDFCSDLEVPEVIDPSDEATETGNYWNLPAILVDSGLVGQLGRDNPMLVMKGHVKWTLPLEQTSDVPERPDGPRGVLFDVVSNIRIGVMTLNDNGSKTECEETVAPSPSIIKYCPHTNKDGAQVVAQIEEGMFFNDNGTPENPADDIENWDHYMGVIASINDTRATAWTPLAEAVYTALGYYGQNKVVRLDDTDFKLPGEGTPEDPWPDPVQYWCQDNHVLVITEGASTADINATVKTFADTHDDGDGAVENVCTDGLNGSTYLDNITWFGQNATVTGESADASNLYTTLIATNKTTPPAYAKQPVTTHIVTTGSLRTDGTGECSPATLMTNAAQNGGTTLLSGENPADLEKNLKRALSDILSRASAGSAASVISSSRSGEGGVYQAIFWPQIDRPIGEKPLTWVGDVHAFFIDDNGHLWDDFSAGEDDDVTYTIKGQLRSEDRNGNGVLDTGEDTNDNGKLDGDRRVITYFNNTTNSTHICFRFDTETGQCLQSDYNATEEKSFELRDFNGYLWSANEQLNKVSDISSNRPLLIDGKWDFTDNKRYIFTWNDLDNDGIVEYSVDDSNEVLGLVPGNGIVPSELEIAAANVINDAAAPRTGLLSDFSMTSQAKLDEFIAWYRGEDSRFETFDAINGDKVFTPFDASEDENLNGVQDWVYRCRRYPSCDQAANLADNPVWRLGDVIHSTPTLVARPAEGFHFIYRDLEYSQFYKKYLNRRHVVYFGANDGMLHAVNAGFFLAGAKKFIPCTEEQRDPDDNTKCKGVPYTNGYPALGDELWAYVPYNLQKHLSCLSSHEYSAHKYFVDGPPRVFDVRIFPEDDDHPGGWGTILVGYMRFGGAPIAGDDNPALDNREFVSAYFILDVTNPEKPPKLLAEMTVTDGSDVDLGFTTSMPAVIAMKNDVGGSEWFLILGNGPTELTGENTGTTFLNQKGRIAVVPLNSLTGFNWKSGSEASVDKVPFRIPDTELSTAPDGTQFGIFNLPDHVLGEESFISDIVTVDFDITAPAVVNVGVPYKTDVAYFGTTDGIGFVSDIEGRKQWNGGGRMFRLLANDLDGTGKQRYTYPDEWQLKPFLDAKSPITAAANVGSSGGGNFWVYFGTGRFYTPDDKTDYSQQYFFGVKEPVVQSTCEFTWEDIKWWPAGDSEPRTTNPGLTPGEQGLLRSDPIRVIERGSYVIEGKDSLVFCQDENGVACSLPLEGQLESKYYPFANLEKYIVGENCKATADSTNGIDGWYRKLTDPRERSLSMPTLLGGLTTFTTYQPSDDLCTAEGSSFLYAAYSRTGTAWSEDVIGTYIYGGKEIVRVRLDLGKGLALTPSLQTGTGDSAATAYIQTSTGDIVKVEQKELPFNTYKSGRQSWRGK